MKEKEHDDHARSDQSGVSENLTNATIKVDVSDYESARVRAWRAVRLLEPSMEAYDAAMAVYVAAFGKHPGEVEIVGRTPEWRENAFAGQPWPGGTCEICGVVTEAKQVVRCAIHMQRCRP